MTYTAQRRLLLLITVDICLRFWRDKLYYKFLTFLFPERMAIMHVKLYQWLETGETFNDIPSHAWSPACEERYRPRKEKYGKEKASIQS